MPRFQNVEPRMRGFNGNKIVFGSNDPPREVSAEDLKWLKEDPSFVECIQKGRIRDLDGAMKVSVAEPDTAPEGAPSQSTPAILLQIQNLESTDAVQKFMKGLSPGMSAEDLSPIKQALFARQAQLTLMKK